MDKLNNVDRGRAGEALAESFLRESGLIILRKNYRFHHAEIDIIATDGNELIIVEVKMRQNNAFGFPEEAISKRKENLLKKAGYAFKEEQNSALPLRFDVIAISIEEAEIKYFKDAF